MRNRTRKPIKYYSPKRRAIYAAGDQINHTVLFNMHAWTCFLCRKPMDPSKRAPHPLAATVEHLVPLCMNGTHTWTNVVPAHWDCNRKKGENALDGTSVLVLDWSGPGPMSQEDT